MIARGFKSVIWVAAVGSAALGCYMVSLRVATERNELDKVERQIIEARKDIRSLQTELGTRGRMTQLEQWNAEVLALSAPSSAQFMKDEFTLARLYQNDPTVADRSAEVRLASAEAPVAKPAEASKQAAPAVVHAVAEPAAAPPSLIHRASFAAAPTPAAVPARSSAKPTVKPDSQRIAEAAPAKRRESAAQPATKPAVSAAKAGAKPVVIAAKAGTKPLTVTVRPAAAAARSETKPLASAAKAASKPAAGAGGKPAAKPAPIVANPVAAAAPRPTKAKGSGGN